MGTCDFSCNLPFIECAEQCVDTKVDPANCGACGNACPTKPLATPICANSQCSTKCNSGYSQCGGQCVDTDTDKQNCGQCGKKCKGMQTCTGGSCG
jgi:Stigma-specific protein, Stig1